MNLDPHTVAVVSIPVLTEAQRNNAIGIVMAGCSQATAARFVGFTPAAFALAAANDPEFALNLDQTRTSLEISLLQRITQDKNWRAAAWALERLFPDRYARRKPNTMSRDQFADAFRLLAEILCEEVPADNRPTIFRRLNEMLEELNLQYGDR